MLAAMMTDTTDRMRRTFGAPLVVVHMRAADFRPYYANQTTKCQADLDAMLDAGMLVLSESNV